MQRLTRKSIDVEVPELDASFRLVEMNGTARDAFESATFIEGDTGRRVVTKEMRARLVSLCLVGDDGVRLYADDEAHQLNDDFPASVLLKFFDEAQKLNGYQSAAIEVAAKNSESVPTSASGSA